MTTLSFPSPFGRSSSWKEKAKSESEQVDDETMTGACEEHEKQGLQIARSERDASITWS